MTYDPHAFDAAGIRERPRPLSLEHPRVSTRKASVRKWHARWNASCPCGWKRWSRRHAAALQMLDDHLHSGYHRPIFELNNLPLIGRLAGYRDGLEIG